MIKVIIKMMKVAKNKFMVMLKMMKVVNRKKKGKYIYW